MQKSNDTNYKPFLNKSFVYLLTITLLLWFWTIFYAKRINKSNKIAKNNEIEKMLKWWINAYFENNWKYPEWLYDLETANIIKPIELLTKRQGETRFIYKKTNTGYTLTK